MKKVILMFAALILIAASALLCSPAWADMFVKVTQGPYSYSNGGEFTAELKGSVTVGGVTYYGTDIPGYAKIGDKWQTFCVETNEYFNPGTTYEFLLATVSYKGGVGGGSPDPLDPKTAYLFTQFSKGTLSNYNFSGTPAQRSADAGQLQRAIWSIENELTLGGSDSKAKAWVTEATNAHWTDIGLVRVMQLYGWDSQTNQWDYLQQDQLIVPAPAAIGLGMLGLALIGWLKRRVG
jgi:hypothetical protein